VQSSKNICPVPHISTAPKYGCIAIAAISTGYHAWVEIWACPDGIGNNGSDFTVGAVLLRKGMGNFFKGQLCGLAVFARALS